MLLELFNQAIDWNGDFGWQCMTFTPVYNLCLTLLVTLPLLHGDGEGRAKDSFVPLEIQIWEIIFKAYN